MKTIYSFNKKGIFLFLILNFCMAHGFALEQIIRPFQSVRSAGMGSTRILTGEYVDNFFGNPALVTDNPERKWTFLNVSAETTSGTLDAISDLTGGNILSKVSGKAGQNLHGRIQTVLPALYIPSQNISWGFGLLMSTQFDVSLRRNFSLSPNSITDIGPAVTAGKRFFDKRLSVGVTSHLTYRLSTREGFSFVDILKGQSLSPLKSGGEGMHIDFGTGVTYLMPWKPGKMDVKVGLAINNILGGSYTNLGKKFIKNMGTPQRQKRDLHFGISFAREPIWLFDKLITAFEVTDIIATKGSLYKRFHLGAEAQVGFFRPRVGINQGYLAGGVGIDFRYFALDFATYGEELSLNTGEYEDRRFALSLEFKM